VRIVTSLLHANYQENIMTRFSTNKQNRQRHPRQLNHQKTKVCVINLLAAIFGDREIKGYREKGE